MKIYDIQTPKSSEFTIEELVHGSIVQSFSGSLFIRTNVIENDSVLMVNLEDGLACRWLKNERNFTPRPDIVLTTDCNLRNRPA